MAAAAFEHEARPAPRRIRIVARDEAAVQLLAPAIAALGLVRSDDAAGGDVVLWATDADAALDRVLDDAAAGGARVVIAAPDDKIDGWGFAIGLPGVELVPERDQEGLVRAIGRAPRGAGYLAREGAADDAVQRLRELGSEVTRIAQALDALGPGGGVSDRRPPYRAEGGDGAAVTASAIRGMIRARRLRDQYFASELFADPAWDILLDLTAADIEGRDVAVSSLCIAGAVPPTTALRWISTMTEQGLLVRVADAGDRRRVFIRLSAETAERMKACLTALLRSGAPVA